MQGPNWWLLKIYFFDKTSYSMVAKIEVQQLWECLTAMMPVCSQTQTLIWLNHTTC
jgi:hypothetical protein